MTCENEASLPDQNQATFVAAGCFLCPWVEATPIISYLAPEIRIYSGNPTKKKIFYTPEHDL